MPPVVVATASCDLGNSRNTAAKTRGIRIPPANPCTTLAAIIDGKSKLAAHAMEASVKTTVAAANSSRIEKTRVRSAVKGIAIISAMRYEVCTQLMRSAPISRATCMTDSDVTTTWTSRIAMNMPRHRAPKPAHVARLALTG